MKILLLDDEQLALECLEDAVCQACPTADVYAFRRPGDLLEFTRELFCDIAFLDIELRGMNGVELARELKLRQPRMNIIFVTSYSEYMGDAFSLRASGYLLKPVTREAVENELINLRHPIVSRRRVRVQTFGSFEVYVDGALLAMTHSKAKELLAYLVDRKGASTTTAEAAAVLWEDKAYSRALKNQFQHVVLKLVEILKGVQAEDILIRKWNSLAIDPTKIDCDYYGFLTGDPASVNAFTGEYMANYSWAELTTGFLSEHSWRSEGAETSF